MARASDGISQLAELMRSEQVPQKPAVDPQVRHRRRLRGRIAGAIVTVVILGLVGGYVGYTLTAPVGAAVATTTVPDVASPAAATVTMVPYGASALSVSGADTYLGPDASGVWMTAGGAEALPIASISKLITALVVLSKKPLASADDPGPTLTFDKADNALYDKYYVLGATIARMPIGSSMSEQDALETMLVASASNYAEAIAGWAFGSNGAYVSATKAWLAAHGLTSTTIVEPTGIDPRNASTSVDLIALGKIAMADPVVSRIAAMPTTSVPGFEPVGNTNNLLGVDGITGLKTGTLDGFGSNLLFSSTLDVGADQPLTIVGVILGGGSGEGVNRDTVAMLDSIKAGFHQVVVGELRDPVGTYTTPWGESAQMVLGESASLFTWSDAPVTATMDVTTLTTGADGETVGSVTWTAGPNTVTVPIILDRTIAPPDTSWRLTHPFDLGS